MSRTSTFTPFDILELSKQLVVAAYSLTANLPADEKTNLTLYLRNAALKVHLDSVESTFQKKNKKLKKVVNKAKNSLVVIEAIVDVLIEVNLVEEEATTELMQLSSTCYQLLDRLKKDK
jgi:four helix bundle protein